MALVGFVALCLTPVFTGTVAEVSSWVPAAGLGLVLVAWLGARAGLLVLLAAALVSLWRWLTGLAEPDGGRLLLAEPPLAALEAVVGWWLFHRIGQGAPRSWPTRVPPSSSSSCCPA